MPLHARPVHKHSVLGALLCTLLSACGGGGGGGGSAGSNSSAQPEAGCTVADQRSFVRNHIDSRYLFYSEVPTLNPLTYGGTASQYFHDLTRNALPHKDRFSFVVSTAQANAIFESGTTAGVGLEARRDEQGRLRVAYVEPASPAAQAGIQRGEQIVAVNGSTVGSQMTQAQSDALYASAPGTPVTLQLADVQTNATRNINLQAAIVATRPVLTTRVLDAGAGKIGYMVFNDHSAPSEAQLADGFRQLQTAGVQDLVLDLRYNGGGYLYVASQVAYMVAGSASENKVFGTLRHNDKQTARNTSQPFYASILNTAGRNGEPLPTLNLPRVFVLTSGETCSASESIINGLRGVDVDVVTIGRTTCGKPYGMYQTNYCGQSYFALEFEGVNAKGVGGYVNGFAPTCEARESFNAALGESSENLLATALHYRASGSCPATPLGMGNTGPGKAVNVPQEGYRPGWGTALAR